MDSIDWRSLLGAETASIVLAVVVTHVAGLVCRRRIHEGRFARADALLRFVHAVGGVPLVALIAPAVMWQSAVAHHETAFVSARWLFAVGWTGYVIGWLGQAWVVVSVRRAVGAEDFGFLGTVAAWLFAHAWFVLTPLLAGWLAVGMEPHPGPDADLWLPAEAVCYALAHVVTGFVVHQLIRSRTSPVVPPPSILMDAFARAAGDGVLPEVVVAPLRAAGLPTAFALRHRRKPRIVVDSQLIASYPADETTAILLHELGHHRLGHVRRREWTWKLGLLGVLVALMAAGWDHVAAFVVCMTLLRHFVMLPQWRRQELEADRFAADHAGARAIGSALARMHRAHDVPDDFGRARNDMTHPDLVRRLKALGLSPADVAPATT